MLLITDEQHAQAVEAAESNVEYTEAEYLERREFWGEKLTYRWKNYEEATKKAKEALAALQALPEVEVVGYAYEHQDYIGSVIGAAGEWAPHEIALYATKEPS